MIGHWHSWDDTMGRYYGTGPWDGTMGWPCKAFPYFGVDSMVDGHHHGREIIFWYIAGMMLFRQVHVTIPAGARYYSGGCKMLSRGVHVTMAATSASSSLSSDLLVVNLYSRLVLGFSYLVNPLPKHLPS